MLNENENENMNEKSFIILILIHGSIFLFCVRYSILDIQGNNEYRIKTTERE
jgi:hypothetical protein